MADKQKGSMLCPGCRKLISGYMSRCPHCGLAAPGSRWVNTWARSSFYDVDKFITLLIWVNGVMFLLSILIDPAATNFSFNPMSFLSPSGKNLFLLGATGSIPVGHYQRWWTLLSANYLHGGLMHIIFNMIALKQLGPLVAREYGVPRLAVIYTASGILGFLVSVLAGVPFTIGASAAVCGLIGASLYYGKHRGGTYGQAVYRHVSGWVIGLFFFGFMVPGINNWAHGGGLAAGILTGLILGYRERKPEKLPDRVAAGLCALATVLVLAWAVVSGFYFRFLS